MSYTVHVVYKSVLWSYAISLRTYGSARTPLSRPCPPPSAAAFAVVAGRGGDAARAEGRADAGAPEAPRGAAGAQREACFAAVEYWCNTLHYIMVHHVMARYI